MMKFLKNLMIATSLVASVLFMSSCSKFTFPAQGGVNPPSVTLQGDSLCVAVTGQGQLDIKTLAVSLLAEIPQTITLQQDNFVITLELSVDSAGVGSVKLVSVACIKVK